MLYENHFLVNSFHAVLDNPEHTVVEADEQGYISPNVGDTICFLGPVSQKTIPINTLIITAGASDILVALNGNEMYPLYIPAGKSKGVEYMYVYSIKLLSGGDFFYEAMTDKV